jgi:hypothetical protein
MISPGRMRRVDALLGRMLCWALTLHRRVSETLRSVGPPPVRRILFIKLIEQGATVLAYDAVRAATERVGRDHVFFCVFADNRDILDLMDVIPQDNVLTIRSDTVPHLLADSLSVIRRARAAGIDTTIDMEFFARGSAILGYPIGAARRVGLHGFAEGAPYRGDLMTHRLIHNPFLHVARAYRLLVDALDVIRATCRSKYRASAAAGATDVRTVRRRAPGSGRSSRRSPARGPTPCGRTAGRSCCSIRTGDLPPPGSGRRIASWSWDAGFLARPDVTVLVTGSKPNALP